jgi:hypothetical protein
VVPVSWASVPGGQDGLQNRLAGFDSLEARKLEDESAGRLNLF